MTNGKGVFYEKTINLKMVNAMNAVVLRFFHFVSKSGLFRLSSLFTMAQSESPSLHSSKFDSSLFFDMGKKQSGQQLKALGRSHQCGDLGLALPECAARPL